MEIVFLKEEKFVARKIIPKIIIETISAISVEKFPKNFCKNTKSKNAKNAVEIFKIIGKSGGSEKNFLVKNAVIIYIGTQESPTARAEPSIQNFFIKIILSRILTGSATPKVKVRAQACPVPARS